MEPSGTTYRLAFSGSRNLSEVELSSCLDLIEETSRKDYETSSIGWDREGKRKELKAPEMRFVLVKNGDGEVRGFTALMPCWEGGEAVLYCYEIHLKPELQG